MTDYFYSRWMLIVRVTERKDNSFAVFLDDPNTHNAVFEKQFKAGADPSQWIAERIAKYLPKQITALHKQRNDDPQPEPVSYRTEPHWNYYDEWDYSW